MYIEKIVTNYCYTLSYIPSSIIHIVKRNTKSNKKMDSAPVITDLRLIAKPSKQEKCPFVLG